MKTLRHYLNSMHVFCRLIDFGVNVKIARKICRVYEKIMHPLLYREA